MQLQKLFFWGVILLKYEINDETLAILPFDKNKTRVIEKNDEYIIDDTPYEVMEHSCSYFGSSFNGRVAGSKSILGSVYKIPVIVEETQKLIFFPTEALASENVAWISYKNIRNIEKHNKKSKIVFNNGDSVIINCPYFSVKNQVFRCNMLEAIFNNRKNGKKNDKL